MFNRLDIVDAYAAFARHEEIEPCKAHEDCKATRCLGEACARQGSISARFDNKALSNLTTVSVYRCSKEEVWDTLNSLEESVLPHYWALVAKVQGPDHASEMQEQRARIAQANGVRVYVSSSEDDPFQVMFHIADPIANAWCDAHGSLDGGTWEHDGSDFCYDIGMWTPELFTRLEKEGFDLAFSDWNDPDDRDHAIMEHWQTCPECEGTDFRQAEEHSGL